MHISRRSEPVETHSPVPEGSGDYSTQELDARDLRAAHRQLGHSEPVPERGSDRRLGLIAAIGGLTGIAVFLGGLTLGLWLDRGPTLQVAEGPRTTTPQVAVAPATPSVGPAIQPEVAEFTPPDEPHRTPTNLGPAPVKRGLAPAHPRPAAAERGPTPPSRPRPLSTRAAGRVSPSPNKRSASRSRLTAPARELRPTSVRRHSHHREYRLSPGGPRGRTRSLAHRSKPGRRHPRVTWESYDDNVLRVLDHLPGGTRTR